MSEPINPTMEEALALLQKYADVLEPKQKQVVEMIAMTNEEKVLLVKNMARPGGKVKPPYIADSKPITRIR